MVAVAPLLVTERLELWPPVASDLSASYAINSAPETARYLGGGGMADHFQRFSRNAGSWLLYGYGGFMLRRRGTPELIGNCGVFHSWRGLGEDFDDHPEAGWILRHDQVGQGLGFEAMTAVLEWFDREHGARTVVCMIEHGNGPSVKLANKLGFTPLRGAEISDGPPVTLLARSPGAAGSSP
jgi:RimJ/RimL family protein N-acetyltransferase